MTKVSIVSDLHLELADIELPGGDLLILAGDTFMAAPMRENKNDAQSRSLRKRFVKFCNNELAKYSSVIHIHGNHEHYHGNISENSEIVHDFLAQHAQNAVHLNDEILEIEGVVFIGSTLWAPCGVNNGKDWHIGRSMNDFRLIDISAERDDGTKVMGRFSPREANAMHEVSVKFIKREVAKAKKAGKPCVVVTHHAPSWQSDHEDFKYAGENIGDAYYSHQDKFILKNPHIAVWCHGHNHRSCRYEIGTTTVVSNQRGYFPNERCSRFFDPTAADFDLEGIKRKQAA